MISNNPLLNTHWRSWLLLLLFAPFTLVQLSFSKPRPIDLSNEDKHKRRAKIAPRPLPVRKRALSAPLEKPERVGFLQLRAQVTDDQSFCPLFNKLPAEIRNQIWNHVLGGYKIRVLKRHRKLGYARCRHMGERCPAGCVGYYDANWYKEAPSLTGCLDDVFGIADEQENKEDRFLSLLLTCRLIYSEAIDVLYSQNDFAVRDLDCITYLSISLLPQRFHRIRTLQVNWCVSGWANSLLSPRATPPYDWGSWKLIWTLVASMRGLKVLRVGLTTRRLGGLTAADESRLFRPFREMRNDLKIEIVTSWCPPVIIGHLQTKIDQGLTIKRVDQVVIDNPPWTFEW